MRRILSFVALFLLFASPSVADVTVTFLDVGQGDAIWVHDDTGYGVLIDCGDRGKGDACESLP